MSTTEILSDQNVSLRVAQVVSKQRQYADLDISLAIHPDFHDIMPLVDLDAVKSAVRNLVLTNYYERPFQPFLGSNLRALLFEPADRFTIISIRDWIKDVLTKHEPRIDSITIQVADNGDANQYDIVIGFRVIAVSKNVNITLYLERLR